MRDYLRMMWMGCADSDGNPYPHVTPTDITTSNQPQPVCYATNNEIDYSSEIKKLDKISGVLARCGDLCSGIKIFDISNHPWSLATAIAIPTASYATYKLYKWICRVQKQYEDVYAYAYLDELDELVCNELDDIEEPEFSGQNTIRFGSKRFILDTFYSFSRNYRKRLHRSIAPDTPVIRKINSNDNEPDWLNDHIEDTTPQGIVRMRYCPDTSSFWWWSDNKNIPYRYLETVARLYTVQYNRLDVFIDIRKEIKNGQKKKLEEENKVKEIDDTNGKNVYARFKKYNSSSSRGQDRLKNTNSIVLEKSNRYSFKGSLSDYNDLFTIGYDENTKCIKAEKNIQTDENGHEELNYEEWIRLHRKS